MSRGHVKAMKDNYIQQGGAKFDILKFVLALIIVSLHSGIIPKWLFPIARLAVPLFFIMTSYFFFLKVSNLYDDSLRKQALHRYLKRNFQLYLFWSVALLPAVVLMNLSWFQNGAMSAIMNIFKAFFISEFFPASWFILSAIYSVIIVFYLSRWLSSRWLLLFSLLLYCLALLDSNYGGLLSDQSRIIFNMPGIRYSLNIPAAMIWIVMGKSLAERPVTLSPMLLYSLIAIIAIVYYLEYLTIGEYGISIHSDCFIMTIPLSPLIFIAIGQSHDIKCKHALWLRKSSIIIYCLHLTLILLISYSSAYFGFESSKPISFIITIFTCICVASLIIFLREKKNVTLLSFAY